MIDNGQKHMLRLIAKESANSEGWAKVSAIVMPLVEKLPCELVECQVNDDGTGKVRLTHEGEVVMKWM